MDKLFACQVYEVSTSKSRLILIEPLSCSINTKESLQSESLPGTAMYDLALASFRASISVMGDLSVLKKKNCKCVNIYYRASPLQKTLTLLA